MTELSSSSDPALPLTEHIPSLDGIRAIAVLLVIFGHTEISGRIPGGFGVTIFFFLSGFLITSLLMVEHHVQGRIDLMRFYARRLVRLMPALILTILAAVSLVLLNAIPGEIDAMTLLSQIFFYFNYASVYSSHPQIDGLGVLWSLSVEEHFYILWPSVFILLMKGHLNLRHLLVVSGAILLWRCYRFLVRGDSEWVIYILTDTRLDSMLYGCLLALMMPRLRQAPRPHGAVMPLLIAASLAALAVSFAWRDETFRSTLRYSLQGIALMPLFYYAVMRPDYPLFRALNWGFMRRLGMWSYSLYLIHMVILALLKDQAWLPQTPWLLTLLVLGLSCLWAVGVYEFAERPFLPLRRRLSRLAPRAAP